MPDTIAARVARGAALLDEKEPGWWQRIDLGALTMRLPCNCILGQLFRDPDVPEDPNGYWESLKRFGIAAHPASVPGEYGFATTRIDDYGKLDAAWRELIESRRAGS